MNQHANVGIQQCIQEVSILVKGGDWRNAFETLALEIRKNPDQILERALVDVLF